MKFSLSEVEELLPGYLSGDLSEKERTIIDEWRKESPENESVYQESCRAWEAIPLLNEMEQFNSFEALKKVNKRIIKSDYSGWWTIIQRIAAILLLPLLVLFRLSDNTKFLSEKSAGRKCCDANCLFQTGNGFKVFSSRWNKGLA